MKPTKLIIKNIGLIADETIDINKPLIIFYGEIKQGKTTLLNCVRWVCGGEFPADILTHGTKEGSIELQFEHGFLRREFYLAKDGKTIKARALDFVVNGRPVSKPVEEVTKLLNPFTLDQDFLIRKKEADRNKYFIELFGVDTSDIDSQLVNLERDASALRSELKGFGDIDLTEHKPVDITELQQERLQLVDTATKQRRELEAELESINSAFDAKYKAWQSDCDTKRTKRGEIATQKAKYASLNDEIQQLQVRLGKLQEEAKQVNAWVEANPEPEYAPEPIRPNTAELKEKIFSASTADTSAVDARISDAGAANARAEQYQKNLKREEQRKAKAKELADKEALIKSQREAKLARVKTINDSCKIDGLRFTDDGEFSYEGTSAAMLSTSQLMQLSKKLSDLYPEGFGISLLDRGESLGRSIFDLIDKAKKDEHTILATVVGERPAVVPEQVGVFVVEGGRVSK